MHLVQNQAEKEWFEKWKPTSKMIYSYLIILVIVLSINGLSTLVKRVIVRLVIKARPCYIPSKRISGHIKFALNYFIYHCFQAN